MKKIAIVVVLLVGGLLAFNYATQGKLTLMPSFALSEEEQQVKDLEDRFDAARKQYAQANRTASVGGIDTTSDVIAAQKSVRQVARELKDLTRQLSSDSAKRRAGSLDASVQEFLRELG
jgi:hypothetical protein